jgi:uncharacterized RDD family membrane protein YckC
MHMGAPPPQYSPQYSTAPSVNTTAGPAVLAGWWLRFGGYVLDGIIVGVPTLVIRFVIDATQQNNSFLSTGGGQPDTAAQVGIVVTSLLIGLGYPYALLRHNGQTVGMMAVGARAVDRISGTPLSPRQAGRRVLAFFFIFDLWAQIATIIGFSHVYGRTPIGETLFLLLSFAGLLTTAMWPLGNPLKQTLQDKAADTVVVRVRS